MTVPSATEQEIDDLTELSLKCSYNVLSSSSTGVSSDSVERILDFFKGVNHPVFRDLGMSLDRSAVGDLGDTILTQFLAKNDVDVDNYGEVVKQVSTIWEDPDFAWRPILAHTLRNGTLEGLENKGWADYIEQSEGRIDDMFDYLFRDEVKMFNQKLDLRGGVAVNDRTVDELAGGVVAYVARNADWTDPVNNAKVRFLKYIATKRLATAASISDPIDFFKYLDRYRTRFKTLSMFG